MFSKKVHVDVKKSVLKIQDYKKDAPTRLKHLKIVLDNVDSEEAKNVFESNFSHIYLILYDNFVLAEANLRQREISFHLVHKAHREELECVLLILEKILVLLPELLSRRWQSHSLTRIMSKLLHPGNSCKLRKEAIKYFLLWYQTLGENAPDCLHAIFATLVPGFPSPLPGLGLTALSRTSAPVFHDPTHGSVTPVEILPLLPPQSGDKLLEDPTKFFLDALLEFMVIQVTKIEWRDRAIKQHKCFMFLFERFKQFYLPHIFPMFSHATSLYKPILDLPELRKAVPTVMTADGKRKADPFAVCRVAVIKWVATFTHLTKNSDAATLSALANSSATSDDADSSLGGEMRRVSHIHHESSGGESNHSSMISQFDGAHSLSDDSNTVAVMIVREALYSSRDNVNFVHEVYRQAFMLGFQHSPAIRKAITVYKDWIQMNVIETPTFMLEPLESHKDDSHFRNGPLSFDYSATDANESNDSFRTTRLRNDSYLGAIHRENLLVRAGLQNVVQTFVTHAANVFMLQVPVDCPLLLEEQVDTCKRVLNVYRYMVMHTSMESRTWEQLLTVLLQITSLILSKTPPKRKEETLGGKLAPAIFQTLIVTWIKANLNVVIASELWDRFLSVLSSLTHWEELIREWVKTLDTLTRVLARHVYSLDLMDLPLDRLTEQKAKKRGSGSGGGGSRALSELGRPTASMHLTRAAAAGKGPQPPGSALPDQDVTQTDSSFGSFRQHSPWKRCDSGIYASRSQLSRSVSEGNLTSRLANQRRRHARDAHSSHNNTVCIPVLPVSLEQDVERLLASLTPTGPDFSQRRVNRKSRSMDSLRFARGSTLQFCESEGATRTPSPAPSSGVESNSIKDSPMQIDVITGDISSLDTRDDADRQSVMAGGSVRGWLPDVAVVLWRRMLGALGDVNLLRDPALHLKVFEYLIQLCDTFAKIRLNQSVSADNQMTPPPPELVPPLTLVAPWCFKALSLPDSYHRGKLCAYRLLCQMTVAPQDVPLPLEHVTLFLRVLHQGLVGTDQPVVNTLVRYCGARFFSLALPGHSLLLFDFIHAANTIVSSSDIKGTPRTEAATILGALLCLPNSLRRLPVWQPNSSEFNVMSCAEAKEHILSVLLKCSKREPAGQARCIALSSLGIFLYHELTHGTMHPKLSEAVNVLLMSLRKSFTQRKESLNPMGSKFNHKMVALLAADLLFLLCDHADTLMTHFPEMPSRIIEMVALTLSRLSPAPATADKPTVSDQEKRLLCALMLCLGEWCMRVPPAALLDERRGTSLLLTALRVLDMLQGGEESKPVSGHVDHLFHPEMLAEFVPDIQADDMRQSAAGARSSPAHRPPPPGQDARQAVQLAAKMVTMHLVNHVGHFPMGIGASRLSSMVVEHDDVPGLSAEKLCAQVFTAPNIQLFVLSDNLLLSLVELPTLEVPGGGAAAGLRTAPSQVRVILRDLGGKASWDASILYCTPKDAADARLNSYHSQDEDSMEDTAIGAINSDEAMLTSMFVGSGHQSCPPQHTLRHRPPDVLPTFENAAQDLDQLDDLLQYLGHTSSELLDSLDTPRNIPAPPPPPLSLQAEHEIITAVVGQRNAEIDYLNSAAMDLEQSLSEEPCGPRSSQRERDTPFQHARRLFSHLGLAGWERRSRLQLLAKNDKLLRELRNLDSQQCRETHKIAVVYVAEGQEDKNSILSNTCGSQAYEEFIAGLAWEVELESHTGFLGGLQRNKSTGETAPYYATSFLEAIFHVATRMPSDSHESLLQKTRHLGNDEVHIVWSEHLRDYRREVIPTEFCDVLIVIYPLPSGLCRIQVSRKPDVPFFGPLFDEVIVDHKVLPGLVRATAISASRAKRSMLPFYQNYYEERFKSLDLVIRAHKESTTFEDFAAQVYSPVQNACPLFGGSRSSVQGSDSARSSLSGARTSFAQGVAQSTPPPLKKLSLETAARKSFSSRSESVSLTPPSSPTSRKSH